MTVVSGSKLSSGKVVSRTREFWDCLRELIWPTNFTFKFPLYLFWWGGHWLFNALPSFKFYCASSNLGITKTWICQLNFAERPTFSGLRFFNEPEISDSGPPAQSPSRRTCAHDFYVLKKSIDLRWVWTRELWISRRAGYPETTETTWNSLRIRVIFSIILFSSYHLFDCLMAPQPWVVMGYLGNSSNPSFQCYSPPISHSKSLQPSLHKIHLPRF